MHISRFTRAATALLLAFSLATTAASASTPTAAPPQVYAPDPPPATADMFRAWVAATPGRAAEVAAFEHFLATENVADVFPTFQILRSESLWAQCGGQPFVIAARAEWPHVVGTLRFIRDQVVPQTGPLEIVSGYRDPALNTCSGGRSASAHMDFWALDLEPLAHISRDQMVANLCPVFWRRGPAARIGLGFYDDTRFHVDSRSFRTWGADSRGASSPCNSVRA